MAKSCKAGCSEFRKLMKRYPGFTLVSTGPGGRMNLIAPNGKPVRLPDGRRLTIISSPRNQHAAAAMLARRLSSLGIAPTA